MTASGSEVRGTGKTTAGPGSSKVIATVDDFVVFWRGLLNAIDPFKIGIKRVTEERDEVSSIAELTGRDIKTGVDVSFHVAFWIRIQDNVIVEAENVVDFHRYLAQVRPDHEHTLRDHLGMDA
ncbi:MAG: nuclear transport factor 2 family protein [Planctomycetota bacterium]